MFSMMSIAKAKQLSMAVLFCAHGMVWYRIACLPVFDFALRFHHCQDAEIY
jgi:hypothetical protein